ncbi:ABC transporter permease [Methanocella arvoryzae]|nr:ABC transporter permease subunit [Methanocella arvoryzae]
MKDFYELIGNGSVITIILAFMCVIVLSSMYTLDQIRPSTEKVEVSGVMLNQLSYDIMSYGSIFAIVIGFFSMSVEKTGKALNTLVTKPVFRDTIINGKMLACMIFLMMVFCLVIAIYTAVLLILGGDAVGSALYDYVLRLPIVLIVVVLDAMFYMALSILLSILIRRPGVALLSTMVMFIFLDVIEPSVSFACNIVTILGDNGLYDHIRNFSPSTSLSSLVSSGLFDASVDIDSVLSSCWGDMTRLLLFVVILMFLCYTMFIRRDIS